MPSASFPLVDLRSVANAQNEWVALLVQGADQPVDEVFLHDVFGEGDLLQAILPLDCVVRVGDVAALSPSALDILPAAQVLLAVHGSALGAENAARRLAELQMLGYRVMLDGAPPEGVKAPVSLRTVARDCRHDAPPPVSLPVLFGPHLAYDVPTRERYHACENAGFAWFSGDYVFDLPLPEGDDGASRKRMLTMLALLARDADSSELEAQLKQDPVLSYHLLKLVNSAAFSTGTQHITSFAQAISRLGRRQLQRWLQLLLYARQNHDDPPNPLLALAALRGAALETLCESDGGDRDEQDLAFMTGVFSLLDRQFHMSMADVVRELTLPGQVEAALLDRAGVLGQRLRLVEGPGPTAQALVNAGVDAALWWQAQLTAYHWAIQVARNV
jgi:EAL and modified HD-GYP domain-containing signal transduction protein